MMTATMNYPVEETDTYELMLVTHAVVEQLQSSEEGIFEFTPVLLRRMNKLIGKMPSPPSPLPKECLEGKPIY